MNKNNIVTQVSNSEEFFKYFKVELALTPEQKLAAYGVRYRVYCEEFSYEERKDLSEFIETDIYDKHSVACLITHRESEVAAACIRLVQPPAEGDGQLPLEHNCSDKLDRSLVESLRKHRGTLSEVSRLAIDRRFRYFGQQYRKSLLMEETAAEKIQNGRQGAELDFGRSNVCRKEHKQCSRLAQAACLSAYAIGDILGNYHLIMMMEQRLSRLVGRIGGHIHRLHRDIDYHGMRAPYYTSVTDAVQNMRPELRHLYRELSARIEADYATHLDSTDALGSLIYSATKNQDAGFTHAQV